MGVKPVETFILDNIPYEPDLDQLRAELHIEPGSESNHELEKLAREARAIAKPKGVYRLAFIDSENETQVVVEGVTFTSRVLRVNLNRQRRVFPYVATCGRELDAWARAHQRLLQSYLADMIAEQALEIATEALENHMQGRYRPGTLSVMSPGSLADWPIEEQRPLFEVLGDTRKMVGVELNESLMMIPVKSVSGIRFSADHSFNSCQLCPRERCRGRRSPYDPELYEKKYSLK